MSSNALLNRTAAIIRKITPQHPADITLRHELVSAPLLPGEKRDITAATFAYYRWLRFLDDKSPLQAQIAEALRHQQQHDADPASHKPEALAALAVPDWLHSEIDLAPDHLRQLQSTPALWLRAQTEFARALPRALDNKTQAADITKLQLAAPPNLATAFRYTGTADLFRTGEFRQGLFEIQDLASQLVAHACAPKSTETWWDTCAGEGGKTLHLADLMQNRGLIWATDRNTRRLATLRRRTARAHVHNYRTNIWNGGPHLPTKTKFDGILIDAPCSGAGTWQRNPHARWTTTPDDVVELAAIQRQLLENAATLLKPGGRLIYSVCTLTKSETTRLSADFTAAHPELQPLPLFGTAPQLTLHPQAINANGMFLAAWQKS